MDRKSQYSELLKDPRWQKLRLKILERDGWRCRFCGATDKTLHVHHKVYEKGAKPWEYEGGCLLTLCEDCHEWEYAYRRNAEEWLIRVLRLGEFSADQVNELGHILSRLNTETLPAGEELCPKKLLVRLQELCDRLESEAATP